MGKSSRRQALPDEIAFTSGSTESMSYIGVVVRSVTHLPFQFGVVWASTHIFNTEEDVNRLAVAIRKKLA